MRFAYSKPKPMRVLKMRERFEQQLTIGRLLIEDTEIPTAKRAGSLPGLCAALKEIFITPKWNEEIFEVLEDKILSNACGYQNFARMRNRLMYSLNKSSNPSSYAIDETIKREGKKRGSYKKKNK